MTFSDLERFIEERNDLLSIVKQRASSRSPELYATAAISTLIGFTLYNTYNGLPSNFLSAEIVMTLIPIIIICFFVFAGLTFYSARVNAKSLLNAIDHHDDDFYRTLADLLRQEYLHHSQETRILLDLIQTDSNSLDTTGLNHLLESVES